MSKILDLVLAGTPPQFDNDASLATTEFVRQALGNINGQALFTAAGSLAAADAGKYVHVGSDGNYTVTLPSLASVPDGAAFVFQSSATGTKTIERAGSDTIFAGTTGPINSVALGAGDSLHIIKQTLSGNARWQIVGGSVMMRYSENDFAKSLGASGYQRLPSGLIVQWGGVATNSSGLATWTYPIPFPNSVYRVFATAVFGGTYYGASINGTPTDTSAPVKLSAAVVANVNMFAIGR